MPTWYVDDVEHTGPVKELGPGREFTTWHDFVAAANGITPSGTVLLLVHPGTYAGSTSSFTRHVHLRGMGLAPDEVFFDISADQMYFNATPGNADECFIENIKVRHNSGSAISGAISVQRPVTISQCYLESTNSNNAGCFASTLDDGALGHLDVKFRYCTFKRNAAGRTLNAQTFNSPLFASRDAYFDKCELKESLVNSGYTIAQSDYVTTPAAGYGYLTPSAPLIREGYTRVQGSVSGANDTTNPYTVRAWRKSSNLYVGAVNTDALGAFELDCHGYEGSLYIIATRDYGDVWRPSTPFAVDALCFPTAAADAAARPRYYKVTAGGGGVSGGSEPAWPTDGGTVVDGALTWTDQGVMEDPRVHYPVVPAAY